MMESEIFLMDDWNGSQKRGQHSISPEKDSNLIEGRLTGVIEVLPGLEECDLG